MHRLQLVRLLLTPSLSSGGVVFAGALIIIAASAWSYINDNQMFYETLFGIYGFKTLIIQAPDSVWILRNMILGSNATYYVLIIICGLAAGLTTYTVLETLRHAAQGASQVWHEMQSPSQLQQTAFREDILRLLLRIITLGIWGVYIVIFLTTLFPATIVFTQSGIDSISMTMTSGWWYIAGGFGLLVISLHIHVILARLLLLRVRLFGSSDVEIAEQT
jgi:hypothetical protein